MKVVYDELVEVLKANNLELNDILCFEIRLEDYRNDNNNIVALLPIHVYSEERREEIINMLRDYSYDSGFGIQYLYGTVWFKDGTWMSRSEYDGSEWWDYYKLPTPPDYLLTDGVIEISEEQKAEVIQLLDLVEKSPVMTGDCKRILEIEDSENKKESFQVTVNNNNEMLRLTFKNETFSYHSHSDEEYGKIIFVSNKGRYLHVIADGEDVYRAHNYIYLVGFETDIITTIKDVGELFFERVDEYGIKINSYGVPCYSFQNGYYDHELGIKFYVSEGLDGELEWIAQLNTICEEEG